jgi:hypothetical protein
VAATGLTDGRQQTAGRVDRRQAGRVNAKTKTKTKTKIKTNKVVKRTVFRLSTVNSRQARG